MNKYQLYINGSWQEAESNKTYEIKNPATQEVVATASYGDERDAQKAIQAAHQAFKEWASTPAKERADLLMKLYLKMLERAEEFARTITIEMGKPIKEARGEVKSAAEYILWNAEEGKRTYGETIPASIKNKRLLTIKQPVGPVGAITPWNFPLAMVTRKLSPALAAGCTVVIKPASQTPGSAIQFVKLAEEVGFPKGVINLVTGSAGKIGNEILTNPLIKKVTFTGSTEIGKDLMKIAADQVKRVSMELGGHAPFIVFEDANLEAAAEGALASKFRNTGQTCVCANRIYVHSSIKDQFAAILKAKVEQMKIGNGLLEDTDIGPVIDEKGYEKALEHITDAVSKGAELISGGTKFEGENGHFLRPAILTNVQDHMLITQEETFGPVAPLYSFETEEEVLEKANATVYGLAAYFYTNNLSRAVRMYEGLEYGMVGCNDPVPTTPQGPFGGIKESGMGKEGGPHCLEDFMETKFVSMVIE